MPVYVIKFVPLTKEDVRSAVWDSLEVAPPTGSYGERFITNIDALISSRATPDDILLDPAVKIDAGRLNRMPAFDDPIEGTISFLTTETYPLTKTVVISEVGVSHYLEGYIDLSEAVAGEPVDVIYLMSIITPVDYKEYARETYDGAPAQPMLYVITRPARYGIKVEMYMESAPAADRTFPYQFFRRRVV